MYGALYFDWRALLRDIFFILLALIGLILIGALLIVLFPIIFIIFVFVLSVLVSETMIKFAQKEDTLFDSLFFGTIVSLMLMMVSTMPLTCLQMDLFLFGKIKEHEGIIFLIKEYDLYFTMKMVAASELLFWLWAILHRLYISKT